MVLNETESVGVVSGGIATEDVADCYHLVGVWLDFFVTELLLCHCPEVLGVDVTGFSELNFVSELSEDCVLRKGKHRFVFGGIHQVID